MMKVQDAILQLQEMYNPNEDIIIAWWEYEAFSHIVTKDQWKEYVELVDDNTDWADVHDQMAFRFEDLTKEDENEM